MLHRGYNRDTGKENVNYYLGFRGFQNVQDDVGMEQWRNNWKANGT